MIYLFRCLKIDVVRVGVVLEKKILNEFKRNGFRSFNLNVKKWKLLEDLNTFRILPIYQNTESYCNIL